MTGSLWPWAAALILALTAQGSRAGVLGSQYAQVSQCGPFPRAGVTEMPGVCMGVVAGPRHGLRMPRLIVETRPREFVLTDMGGWVGARGRVLKLSVTAVGGASIIELFGGLRQPHGLAKGPDGKLYVGEKGRIWRFDPRAAAPKMEIVVSGLPEDGLHPLTNLIFAKDGALIVNIGAPTDRCETKSEPAKPQNPCPASTGDRARGALWRLTFDSPGGKVVKTEVLARGLRNSMALAVDPVGGVLIQGENGVDLPGEDEPAEELNLIAAGAHYGWPACWGQNTPLRGSGLTAKDCRSFEPAKVLLPAHSAPLGMIAYDGKMFPSLKGKLVISLHGYRRYGHRIVAIDMAAATGAPGANATLNDVVSGWDRKRGLRPMGGPVGLTAATDGSIWIVEDKNRTVTVLLKADGGQRQAAQPKAENLAIPPQPQGWDAFTRDVLKPKCAACHVEVRANSAAEVWANLAEAGWVGDAPLRASKLARSLTGAGPEKPMPPPAGLKVDPGGMRAFERLLGANP